MANDVDGSSASTGSGPTSASYRVVLASGSPRRRKLLADAGVSFEVLETDADESLDADLLAFPLQAVKKLAERKAGAAVQELIARGEPGTTIVIGADTMVVHKGAIFGKPADVADAARMLRALSGDVHAVHTAVSVWLLAMGTADDDVSLAYRTFVDTTKVTFKQLSDDDIAAYLACGESFDKAGAYAIQGAGGELVERIDGSLDTVIGLPVERLLREFPEIAGRS